MPRHGMTAQGLAVPGAGASTPRRRGLAGWPIRRKLVALVTAPLLVIVGIGVFVTAQTYGQLQRAQDREDIANAALYSNRVAQALQNELISTLGVMSNPAPGTALKLQRDRAATDAAYGALANGLAHPPHNGWDVVTNERAKAAADSKAALAKVRAQVIPTLSQQAFAGSRTPRPGMDQAAVQLAYSQVFDAPRLLTRQLARRIASTGSDGSTVNTASAIGSLAQASAVAADEVVDVEIALAEHKLPDNTRRSLDQSKIEQTDLLRLAETHVTDAQLRSIEAVGNDDERLDKFRATAALAATNATDENAGADEAPVWLAASSQRLSTLDSALDKIIGQASDQAGVDAHSAWLRVGIFGGGALLLLLLITAFTVAVARSVSVPLRRLRTAAGETANVRLPAAVQQIEREGPDAVVSVPPALPPGQEGGPETAEVASAFDGLTSEAVRLASAQMRLRRSLDDAFVSMSRRSQSMVEKQLGIIDELERTEEDPDQLRNLFRLDHLAARMRRYNDNLLVLAGSVVRTRSNAPVPIADVFRAATSEMEQYERVRLQPVSGAAVAGPAAGGLIHLLAELLDNAAMYSPPTSPILMAAAFTAEGGLRLEITDSGVGIPGNELAELNTRLASPGAFDMQVPSRMGLYVVARLAQRGGFAAQLAQRAGAAGTVAEVIVPPSLVIGASGTGFESRTPTSRPRVEPAVPGVRTPSVPVGSPGGRPAPSAPPPGHPAVPAATFGRYDPDPITGPAFTITPYPLKPDSPSSKPDSPSSKPDSASSPARPRGPLAPTPAGSPVSPVPPAAPAARTGGPRGAAGGADDAASGATGTIGATGGAVVGAAAAVAAGAVAGAVGRQRADNATDSATPDPGATEPGATDRGATDSATPDPGATEPGATDRGATDRGATDRGATGLGSDLGSTDLDATDPGAIHAGAADDHAADAPPTGREAARPAGDESATPLPSRRPGAALVGGPLGPPASSPPVPTGPSPFAASALPPGPADDDSVPQNGGAGAAARAGGGFGMPGRPFTAGTPSVGRRAAGAAGPSAATAAAAAAAARAARAGGSNAPTPASALFAARGPATDATGSGVPPGDAAPSEPPDAPGTSPSQGAPAATPGDGRDVDGLQATAPEDGPTTAAPAPSTTGSVQRSAEPARAPAAWEHGPAVAAARGQNGVAGDGATSHDAAADGATVLARRSGPQPSSEEGTADVPAQPDREEPAPEPVPARATGMPTPIPSAAQALAGDIPPQQQERAGTPIFDTVSTWFSGDPTSNAESQRVIDLRDRPEGGRRTSARWSSLGDQRWLATNARAAAAPEVAGTTEVGLPRRRPGANLIPSAAAAAPLAAPGVRYDAARRSASPGPRPETSGRGDADAVRGRLSSYQRGLTSARRARHLPADRSGDGLFASGRGGENDPGRGPGEQGG